MYTLSKGNELLIHKNKTLELAPVTKIAIKIFLNIWHTGVDELLG